jgi:hypothetical protein
MISAVNPLVPSTMDMLWASVTAIALLLAIISLVQIWLLRRSLTPWTVIGWTLAVIVFPLAGSIAWLAIGFAAKRRARPQA